MYHSKYNMAIPLTGTGGLFTRVGLIGSLLNHTNAFQNTTLPTDFSNLNLQYPSNPDLVPGIAAQLTSGQTAENSILTYWQGVAQNTVNSMVYTDQPLLTNSTLSASMQYLITQMLSTTQSVQQSTVSVGSILAGSGNVGNGVLAVSRHRPDGLLSEGILQEKITATCNADGSKVTAGNETFTVNGQLAQGNLSWLYPAGSGATVTLTTVNAQQNNAGGNLLTNSGFDAFTANVPNNWAILVGTAGGTIVSSNSSYTGANALVFQGNGSELTSIAQTTNLTGGTPAKLQPQTVYGVNFFTKLSASASAGVLEVSLVDSTNTVINDLQGTANATTVALTGATTSYTAHSAFFRTPQVLPSTIKVRVRLSTALTSGINVFIDQLALTPATLFYPGGPYLAMFAGSTNFYVPDSFSFTISNNYAGDPKHNFQTLFERLFNMKSMGLLLPTSNSPTISNSLIV